jgi:hypothetical protein
MTIVEELRSKASRDNRELLGRAAGSFDVEDFFKAALRRSLPSEG